MSEEILIAGVVGLVMTSALAWTFYTQSKKLRRRVERAEACAHAAEAELDALAQRPRARQAGMPNSERCTRSSVWGRVINSWQSHE